MVAVARACFGGVRAAAQTAQCCARQAEEITHTRGVCSRLCLRLGMRQAPRTAHRGRPVLLDGTCAPPPPRLALA